MASQQQFFKKYGFLNYVDRWEPSDEPHGQFGVGTLPADGIRLNDHFVKTIWTCHLQSDGRKTVKHFLTSRKSTDFRLLMNQTLNEAHGVGWGPRLNGAMLYNYVDQDYGTTHEEHGNCKMGDLFRFNGDDYSYEMKLDYNFWNRLDRLKTLGLVNDDNTIDDPFSQARVPHVSQITYSNQVQRNAFCINFIGDAATRTGLADDWNSKAWLIPDEETALTIQKQGTHDTIVPINNFVVAGMNGGDDITLEPGRPAKLTQDRTINAGKPGIILHVWK